MKIDKNIKYRKGRPYIEYWFKNRKWPVRCFGEIRKCKVCGCYYFATISNIKKGYGFYCSQNCRAKSNIRENANSWKGGKIIKDGYVYLYKPQHLHAEGVGYIAEHRLVMEKKLGRYLLPSEIVHHKNGVCDDNREENLMLFSNSEHTSYHNKKRVYIKGQKHKSKNREKYGKTLEEMAEKSGITLQGIYYRLKKGELSCVS